jgi:formate dehydrogenase (NADP+) beta subunit
VDEPRYSVRVADHGYWREQIKCQYACPVHTDARGYVRAIAAGDYEQAYLIARGPNPLASLCGRICGAPCEAACRRGTIDQPISIRALSASSVRNSAVMPAGIPPANSSPT